MSDASFVPKTWCVYGILCDEPCVMFFTVRQDAINFVKDGLETNYLDRGTTDLSIMVLVGVDGDAMTIEEFS